MPTVVRFLRPRRTSRFVVPSLGWHSHAPCQLRIYIEDHCQGVGATPGMPMSTPFILSARSKDWELKGISTVRIPDYNNVENDAGSATGSRASTESGHGSGHSSRASSPSGDGTRDGGKGAGDKASLGLSMAPPDSFKSSYINFGGGSAAARRASSERRRSRKGRQPPPADAGVGKPPHSSVRSPWLRLRKSSKMETPSLRRRLMSLWSSLRQPLNTCLAIQSGQEASLVRWV
jgi:hypothetical protein